ncbi:defender against death DAD protein [Trichocladium antarcticum]|uniref:Dolichyl-diphosphooligosaccharide--protein glycosyltransferase subunit OST2 n=1 Tax=Trichocladium antarcticum TaxID=1450529 RepID=A0AAN6ZBS9_9PEZI|nr:defender against death DAD protein [Trichocladium antarcticum]
MAPKQRTTARAVPASSSASPATPIPTTPTPAPSPAPKPSRGEGPQTLDTMIRNVAAHYTKTTPARTKLLDAFMAFLVAVGALQFVYCVVAGNYPFNAFLSGFSATVGQFVLTASLRIQTAEGNKGDFPAVSQERAFADYVVCSLILHFFCVNFIN